MSGKKALGRPRLSEVTLTCILLLPLARTRRKRASVARKPLPGSSATGSLRRDAKAVRGHDDDGCCFAPGAHPQAHAPSGRCRASRGDRGDGRRLPYQVHCSRRRAAHTRRSASRAVAPDAAATHTFTRTCRPTRPGSTRRPDRRARTSAIPSPFELRPAARHRRGSHVGRGLAQDR